MYKPSAAVPNKGRKPASYSGIMMAKMLETFFCKHNM